MTVNCRHISANTFPWFCYVCGAAFISCFFPASCLFKRLPSLSSISLKIKKNYLLNSDGLSLQVARSSREEESEEDFKCVIRQKKEPFLVCVIFPGIIREFGAAPVTFFLLCKSPHTHVDVHFLPPCDLSLSGHVPHLSLCSLITTQVVWLIC